MYVQMFLLSCYYYSQEKKCYLDLLYQMLNTSYLVYHNENLEYKTKDLFIFAYLIRKISFCITDAVSKTEDPLYDTFLNISFRNQCRATVVMITKKEVFHGKTSMQL